MTEGTDYNADRRVPVWDSVLKKRWFDWRWQMSQRISDASELSSIYSVASLNKAFLPSAPPSFRMAVTPFYADLMSRRVMAEPLCKQVLPTAAEQDVHPDLGPDPLDEEKDSPVEGLVHRYTDRALMLLTNRCAVYCRFCNRRRRAGSPERDLTAKQVNSCLSYLRDSPDISEVILSGGDPLTWTDVRLDDLLGKLRTIPSIEIIRICSRIPVVLPYRITSGLCRILREHQPIFLNVHVNHPAELSVEMREACGKLADSGVPLGSQTVLLKGINDDEKVLQQLFSTLLTFRIRPYALYHPDPVQGTGHFRTTIEKGRALMESLTANTSGLAIPHYVLDLPGGRGKIPICTDYVEGESLGKVLLQSPGGGSVGYRDGEKE